MRFTRLLPTLLVATALPASARAQTPPVIDSATAAWHAGRYPDALRQLIRALRAPDGDRLLDTVALMTGERYRTFELSPDGRNPRWSADGSLLSFETGPADHRWTRIVRYADADVQVFDSIPGTGVVVAPGNQAAAYLAAGSSPAAAAARAELTRLLGGERTPAAAARVGELRRLIPRLESEAAVVRIRRLPGGDERALPSSEPKLALGFDGSGRLHLVTRDGKILRDDGAGWVDAGSLGVTPLSAEVVSGGRLFYTAPGRFGVASLADGRGPSWSGISPALSADGGHVAWLTSEDGRVAVMKSGTAPDAAPVVVARGEAGQIANPAVSPYGRTVAYQARLEYDWELFAVTDGGAPRRLTNDIQDDLLPVFLTENRLLTLMGEGRHRRSWIQDLDSGRRFRLFDNNTLRTVTPQYEWVPSPDGTRVAVVADRDGDTVSPERGVYLTDLARPVTRARVIDRLETSLAAEDDLRTRGTASFAPIAPAVRVAVADVSTARIAASAADVFAFGSKFITQPGNRMAIDYYAARLREAGYDPELQWFEPRPGVRTANVVATLRGTTDPGQEYVVSSHFDSVERGPGADDNSSGATALLEVARVMASRPQRATVKFAFFTGEEAGLLGSREYVRRAVAAGERLVGALNNDMVGFNNDGRLDNTIRYSNAGIRDIQHAAAFLFTDLITYDSKYYQNTDAHAYYERYGDIVGGIGSYPILANPHYHREHDSLATIDQQLVAEVAKVTVATVMRLAAAPARLAPPTVTRNGIAVRVDWSPAAESGIRGYAVVWEPAGGKPERRVVEGRTVTFPRVAGPGRIGVKALSGNGLEGWDWAWAAVEP